MAAPLLALNEGFLCYFGHREKSLTIPSLIIILAIIVRARYFIVFTLGDALPYFNPA